MRPHGLVFVALAWTATRAGALSASTRPAPQPSTRPPRPNFEFVICPGFGNDSLDYIAPLGLPADDGLVAQLLKRGYRSRVVPVQRGDWLRVAYGLTDWEFIRGRGTPEGRAFRWYIERVWATVNKARAEGATQVVLIAHSAGGWLARVALGDGDWDGQGTASHQAVRGLVTLGSPHLPPPEDCADQTQGVLREVDRRYAGAHLSRLSYVTVASSVIAGVQDARRGSPERYAFGSYRMVCGEGAVPGDGVVPLCAAHLEGAKQLSLEDPVHSINEPGTSSPTFRWYGSDDYIDQWLPEVEASLGLGDGTPSWLSAANGALQPGVQALRSFLGGAAPFKALG